MRTLLRVKGSVPPRPHNAWCVHCPHVTAGTLTTLTDAGWVPLHNNGWACPQHAPSPLPPTGWLEPWTEPFTLASLRAVSVRMPAACYDRSHWDTDRPAQLGLGLAA